MTSKIRESNMLFKCIENKKFEFKQSLLSLKTAKNGHSTQRWDKYTALILSILQIMSRCVITTFQSVIYDHKESELSLIPQKLIIINNKYNLLGPCMQGFQLTFIFSLVDIDFGRVRKTSGPVGTQQRYGLHAIKTPIAYHFT